VLRFAGWLQSGDMRRNKPKTELMKGEMLTHYFAKTYLPKINTIEKQEITTETPETIWQFWDNPAGRTTPEIVKTCLATTEQYKGNFNHVVLNNATMEHYTDLPDFVMDKFRKGRIDYTHFSDLLRLNLLKNHGGIWLDATAYMTNFTPKEITNQDFFVFLTGKKTGFPYSYMQNCFIRAKKGSALCAMWYALCLELWKNETKYLDYFQHQLLFRVLVEHNPDAKKLFARMPHVSEDEIHGLVGEKLFSTFDTEEWEKIKRQSFFQKTTYKVPGGTDISGTYFQKLDEGNL
jgi:hypothetical protein